MKLKTLSILAIGSLALGACANMSALQTAETLPEGKGEFSVGGGYVNHEAIVKDSEKSKVSAPYLEFQYRRGIMDKLDAGAKITLIGTGGVDVKYQLVDSPEFDLAVGTSLAYLSMSSSSGEGVTTEDTSSKATIIDWTIPVYVSSLVSDGVTLYGSPKYMLRAGDGGTLNVLGVTGGVKIGQDSGVMIETTYGKGLGSSFQTLQFNAAFFMKGDAWL